jgi:mannose-6-phosphate isomerase-like protein (cupin superfamily)
MADLSEAYYVMAGAGTVTVDGETAPIHTGDSIPIDLGQSKSFTVTENAPLELLVFGIARDMKTKEAFAADPANAN